MLFTPSAEILGRLRAELSGAFIDRSLNEPHLWLVAKLPTNLIREIRAGATISLRAWVVEIEDCLVLAFGLTVFDDPAAHRTFFGSCRSDDEAGDLRTILADGVFPLQLHNENLLPLLSARCRIDTSAVGHVLDYVPSVDHSPERSGVRERANDLIQASLAGQADQRIRAACDLPVTLEESQPIRVQLPGIGEVCLTDADEGAELERLTRQVFESTFPFGTFINPRVGSGKKSRELCDVLAVSRVREVENEGVFVIQNKAASAFPDGLKRKTARRAKSIQNSILEAISQVSGAIRALKAGEPVYRSEDGTSIEDDPPLPELAGNVEPLRLRERVNQVGHGIVVVSDMHEGVDWDEVFLALAKVWISTRYYVQVLDLQELGRLITHSRGRPAMLEGLLIRRGQVMVEQKTPLIRFHFLEDEAVSLSHV
jgi:hypothetical protein